jgi:hypothetical protein
MRIPAWLLPACVTVCLLGCGRESGRKEDAKDGGESEGGKKERPRGENARTAAVRKILPVGRMTVDAMEPDFSPRQVELSQRLAEAARKDPAWFREHLTKRAAPGEPLPYDPRLGLSKEEYDELNKLNARRPSLRKMGQATLTVSRRGPDVYVFDGGRTLPELTGIEVDLKRDVVRTPRGVAAERFEIKANPSQPSPPGPWSGVGWKLAVKGDANFVGAKIVQLTVGKAEQSNRGVLYYKLLTPQERADIFLLYDLGHAAARPAAEPTAVQPLEKWGGRLTVDAKRPGKPVVRVDLFDTKVTDEGLKELKEFKSLQTLVLTGTKVTDEGLKELIGLTSLRRLDLSITAVSGEGLKELKGLTSLQEVGLAGTKVTDTGLRGLMELKSLQILNLSDTQITDEGLKGLKGLTNLRTLYLGRTKVTGAGLKELKGLKGLQSLSLSDTAVTDAGLSELKELTGLQELVLNGTKITDEGLKELNALTGLQELVLSGTKVTNEGLKGLTELKSLQKLDLSRTLVTDEGLKGLKGLKRLAWLGLDDTKVTDEGLKELKGLKGLQTLSLGYTKVTGAGVKDLKAALPGLRVLGPLPHRE